MAFTDASGTRLAYVAESTENTTPSSPSFKNLRFTSESLNYEKQTVVSDEIRPDRNVSDLIDVGYNVAGDINFELSYATFDDLLEGVMFNTWATNALKNGVTPKAFTFEKTFEQGANDAFMRFTGVKVGTMSLAVTAREIVTGTFGLMGRGHTAAAAALSGATYADANTKAVMSASADVGSLSISGVSPSPTIMSLNLQIENSLREQAAVGQKGLAGIGAGRCVVTGSLEAYFDNLALYNAFVDHDDVGIDFTVGSVTSEKYRFELPKTKLSTGTITAGGNDQDVMAAFDFQAIYDTSGSPANNATLIITRAVS